MKKILVVEDEASIREFEVINLKRSGYDVIEADSGEMALDEYLKNKDTIDIVLLDIMLPGMDGVQVCREIRKESSTVGIIMLTAKTQEMDKVGSLMLGADDYITKPFSPSELTARVDALYRRVAVAQRTASKPSAPTVIKLGDYTLNLVARVFMHKDKVLDLTQVEYQLIEYFFENPNVSLKRNDILKKIWGESYYGDEKIVDVNVRRLRLKVEPDPSNPQHLITIWGYGYKWQC